MVKILAVLLLSLAGFYLGYKLYKANKDRDEGVSLYATITLICALLGGVVLITYLLLGESGWTDDSKAMMRLILVSGTGASFLFLGGSLIIRGRRSSDKLTQIAGLTWVLITLFASGYCLSYINKMNDGWTQEKREKVLSRCNPERYNCLCYLKESMKMFDNPEDMTNTLKDETKNKAKVDKFNETLDSKCPCGSSSGGEEVDF